MSEITKKDQTYIAPTYNRFPVEIVEGKGSRVTDTDGKSYIDMGSGIGVTAFGFGDKPWMDAVTEQLRKVQHTSNLYYTEPCARLAEILCTRTGMRKVFFANSGAEANECAIKAARKYAAEKKGAEYFTVITLKQSFHGRTMTTLAATGQDHFHELFQPLTPGFCHVTANNLYELDACLAKVKAAAIMVECVQGEGGVLPVDAEYLRYVEEICKKKEILFIVDEVQTGNGRTGELYAYMHASVTPDIVTTAKGLGGGLPIGACILGEKVENVFSFGDHGSTFGGNPVACAGAVSIMERLTDEFLAEVTEKSEYIFAELSDAPGVESVSGMGLMIGIRPTEKASGDVVKKCMERGVLCLTAKDKVRLLPALNISWEDLKEAISILKEILGE